MVTEKQAGSLRSLFSRNWAQELASRHLFLHFRPNSVLCSWTEVFIGVGFVWLGERHGHCTVRLFHTMKLKTAYNIQSYFKRHGQCKDDEFKSPLCVDRDWKSRWYFSTILYVVYFVVRKRAKVLTKKIQRKRITDNQTDVKGKRTNKFFRAKMRHFGRTRYFGRGGSP